MLMFLIARFNRLLRSSLHSFGGQVIGWQFKTEKEKRE